MRNKLIAAGVGLFGYGALLGWAITGDSMESKMKNNQLLLGDIIKKKTNELEAAQLLLMQKAGAKGTLELSVHEPVDFDGDTVVEPDVETLALDDQLRGETPEETRENLKSLIHTYTNPEDAEAFAHMAEGTLEDFAEDNTPPFVISHQSYSYDEEGEEYGKDTLTYYPRERILLDEDDDPIDNTDIDHVVGWRNLERFGDESDDGDIVYIRNRRLQKDFEVVREMDEDPPAHVRYALTREEYEANKNAGIIKFRTEPA